MADETAEERARAIVNDIQQKMTSIKLASEECTALAQMTLHWQKTVDTAAGPAISRVVDQNIENEEADGDVKPGLVAKPKATGGKCEAKKALTRLIPLLFDLGEVDPTLNAVIDTQSCSAKHAIAPLERLCNDMQSAASAAMELPSCGERYGLASTRPDSKFVQTVEACMSEGLELLKHVTTLMSVDSQVEQCLSRLQISDEYKKIRFGTSPWGG